MKKILTVSLVAMMAVSAARADIASVEYVTKNYTTSENMTAAIATAKGEAIAASDAKGSAAQALTDAKAYTDAEIGAIGETTVKDYVDTAVNALSGNGGAIAELDGRVDTLETTVGDANSGLVKAVADNTAKFSNYSTTSEMTSAIATAKTGAESTAKGYADAVEAKLADYTKSAELDSTYATDAQLSTAISNEVSRANAAYDAAGAAGTAETNAKSYTDTKIGNLGENVADVVTYVGNAVAEVDGDLGTLQTTVDGHTTLIGALDTKLGKVEATADAAQTAGEVAAAITTKVETLDKADAVVANQFVTAVSETDGIISVSRAALQAPDIPNIEQFQVNGLEDALDNKQAKAGANPYQIVKADGTWAALTYELPDKCKGSGVVCSLISTNGTVGWEVVAK